jgi:dTDP-N-acetylfucosamine:lipid II N-acetylfucosaminyltransferase
MFLDKFIPSFIDFINQNFPIEEHLFVIYGKAMNKLEYNPTSKNVIMFDTINKFFHIIPYISIAKRIIIHGLFFEEVVNFLNQMPQSILDKVYWVMWGGDFYFPEQQSRLKKYFIKNVGNVITYLPKQVDYIREHYGAKGKFIECLFYPDGAYNIELIEKIKKEVCVSDKGNKLRIQIGNSATITNRHENVFKYIKNYIYRSGFDINKIELIVPLSYGDELYKDRIIQIGKEIFSSSFIPLTSFMSYENYLKLLLTIDIGIFYHNRQQGLGNIIQLLGMGKKVYITKDTPQWDLFTSLGIKVYDLENEFNFEIDNETLIKNQEIIKKHFTLERIKKDWENIINE